jgi:uncharacterized membrane protein YesL
MLDPSSSLFSWGILNKITYAFLVFLIHTTCCTYIILNLNTVNKTERNCIAISCVIFIYFSCYFIHFSYNYSKCFCLQHSLGSSLKLTGKVSHPYKTLIYSFVLLSNLQIILPHKIIAVLLLCHFLHIWWNSVTYTHTHTTSADHGHHVLIGGF